MAVRSLPPHVELTDGQGARPRFADPQGRLEKQINYDLIHPAEDKNGRLKSALWGALLGGLEATAKTGDWRAALLGAGVGAGAGALKPSFDEQYKQNLNVEEDEGKLQRMLSLKRAALQNRQLEAAGDYTANRLDAQRELETQRELARLQGIILGAESRERVAAGHDQTSAENNIRSTTTSAENNKRTTATSAENNKRTTTTSAENNIRSTSASREGARLAASTRMQAARLQAETQRRIAAERNQLQRDLAGERNQTTRDLAGARTTQQERAFSVKYPGYGKPPLTEAEIQRMAEQSNLSTDDVLRYALRKGYRIEGLDK